MLSDGGIGRRGQLDLAVAQDDTRSDSPLDRGRGDDDPAPVLVAQPRNGPTCRGDVGHHVVGVVPPSRRSGRVLILETQHVTGPFGRAVQRHPGTQQHVVTVTEIDLVLGAENEAGLLRPPERLHVAQTAMPILQVGFEPVRHVTGQLRSFAYPGAQLAEELRRVRPPESTALRHDLVRELVVAGEGPCRDQGGGRIEIGAGKFELLVDPAHGVAELHA